MVWPFAPFWPFNEVWPLVIVSPLAAFWPLSDWFVDAAPLVGPLPASLVAVAPVVGPLPASPGAAHAGAASPPVNSKAHAIFVMAAMNLLLERWSRPASQLGSALPVPLARRNAPFGATL